MPSKNPKPRIRAGTHHGGRRLLQVHIDLDLWARLEQLRHETAMRERQRCTIQRAVLGVLEKGLAA